jgi:hypothetical protein
MKARLFQAEAAEMKTPFFKEELHLSKDGTR